MKQHILPLLVVVLALLVSCKDTDSSTVELSSTCYISKVNLVTVKRERHTTKTDGTDSLYYQTYTASDYAFRIDQMADTALITNPEPLLYGSLLSRTLLNVTYSGVLRYRQWSDDPNDNLNAQDWTDYVSTDSMDLRKPILFKVVSNDGAHSRCYKFVANVYQASPDSLTWRQVADCPLLGDFVLQRAVMEDGKLCVIGVDYMGAASKVYPLEANPSLQPATMPTETGIEAIDKRIAAGLIDEDASWLPTMYVTGASLSGKYGTESYVMAGLREASYGDTCAVVWGCRATSEKLIRYNNYTREYTLPALRDLHVVAHKDCFMAMGLEQVYGSKRTALDRIYVSADYGVTWNDHTGWAVPAALKGRTEPFTMAAAADKVYVVSGTQVWTLKSNAL